jgi:monoamine oxidase
MRKAKTSILKNLIYILSKEVRTNRLFTDSISNSRRKFISQTTKGSLAIGATLSLPSIFVSCKNQNINNDVLDVAILGGGIAGLNCANNLLNSKLSFRVFEATKRLGGRILTHYNDSLGLQISPEFGADFIDSNHEDMLKLAKEFNIETIDLEKEQLDKQLLKDIYFFENRSISEEEIIQEFNKVAEKISIDTDSLGENYDTPEAVNLDNTSLNVYIDSLNCQKWMKDILTAAFTAEFGLDCSEQSSLNLLDMIDTDTSQGFKVFGESDEKYRLKGGNSKIIEGLVKKIGENKIEKNYEVKEIIEKEDGYYEIQFTNGKIVSSRFIVCTIPFTILRKINLKLKNISPDKQKCINELGYGLNTKLVLGYNGKPWTEKPNSAMGYLFHKDILNGWDSSYNKDENNTNAVYVCYFGGQFSQNLNNLSFKNKLAPSSHLWKTELPNNIVNSFVDELDIVFENSKEMFLDKHVFVNWIDYPYTRGSYSCYKTGQWTTISGLEIEPIGNFYFAGEHCSENFQGYMNGGAETGRRVAETIREVIAKNK